MQWNVYPIKKLKWKIKKQPRRRWAVCADSDCLALMSQLCFQAGNLRGSQQWAAVGILCICSCPWQRLASHDIVISKWPKDSGQWHASTNNNFSVNFTFSVLRTRQFKMPLLRNSTRIRLYILYILSLFFVQPVCTEHTFSSYPGHELKCALREPQVDLEPPVIFASSSFG